MIRPYFKKMPSQISKKFIITQCNYKQFIFHCISKNNTLIHLTFDRKAHELAVAWLKGEFAECVFMDAPHPQKLCQQFAGYFDGRGQSLPKIADSPFLKRATAFQKSVWQLLSQIPYGETFTYGQLAKKLHKKGAARAIGQACHHNPLALIIPCHRVVGSKGMGGFAGGVEIKARLLEMEKKKNDK